jgi:hypothetical protein
MTNRKPGSTTPPRRFWADAEIERMKRKYPDWATAVLQPNSATRKPASMRDRLEQRGAGNERFAYVDIESCRQRLRRGGICARQSIPTDDASRARHT